MTIEWASSPTASCRIAGESLVHGRHRVWGKKIVSSFHGWRMVQQVKGNFAPGSPVTLIGKVSRVGGLALNFWS